MILLKLLIEFFRVGLFAVGGGLATIPFLSDLGARSGWFTQAELANMIAISESIPGPLGVNMSIYVGFHVDGALGAFITLVGLCAPCVIIDVIVARFLTRFRESRVMDAALYGLRPAATALIGVACLNVALIALTTGAAWTGFSGIPAMLNWKAVALAATVFAATQIKFTKRLHPIVFIAFSAIVGVVFQF